MSDMHELRAALYELFKEDSPALRDDPDGRAESMFDADECDMLVPIEIPQFVDFYAGINHASNVGKMFRPDMAPLLPNYRHVPIGYNGRASSVVPSGTPITRPKGQVKPADSDTPVFIPTRELDFELELGFFVMDGNSMGESIAADDAENHMLGLVLVNDWSARDIQRWEYQPLGPFLAKSFATSISPWIVTLDALEPFRVPGSAQDPEPLSHLRTTGARHFDIHLEVTIQTPNMSKPQRVSQSNAKHLYWSLAQMLTHQTSNGTPVETGDLMASGTISGESPGTYGSLLELSWKGTVPIVMEETGETRTFLEDGDILTMTGYCQGEGFRVGFGELTNTIEPAF